MLQRWGITPLRETLSLLVKAHTYRMSDRWNAA